MRQVADIGGYGGKLENSRHGRQKGRRNMTADQIAHVVPGEDHERAMAIGLQWVMSTDPPSSLVVLAPQKSHFKTGNLLRGLPPGCGKESFRTYSHCYARYRNVLACWPTEKQLDELDWDLVGREVAKLCVLSWSEGDTRLWRVARRPNELFDSSSEIVMPSSLDPVTVRALQAISNHVNIKDRFSHQFDKDKVVHAFRLLIHGGHFYDPDAIKVWAMQNGWPAPAAEKLRQVASEIKEGKRHKVSASAPWAEDILHQWHQPAKE